MKLHSLISQGWNLLPIEVEVLQVRGLPDLKFVGLPDQAIKESAIRIKTAIKQSGFSWPEADQIIVNLKPNHLKKSSRGLELAVAAGILWETQQVPLPSDHARWTLYGELNLDGSVQQPEDLLWVHDLEGRVLVSGRSLSPRHRPWLDAPIGAVNHLRYLNEPEWLNDFAAPPVVPPNIFHLSLTPLQAELAMIAAWGRHPLLMAGPAGSGKSLMGEIIHSLGSDPDRDMQKDFWRRRQLACEINSSENFWRPLIRPHHTVTTQGLVGGGNPIRPGELARAHHGTLILDELLEFKPTVMEALREPLETNRIRLARASGYHTYDCQFHFIATTNLCPCGEFVPKTPTRCRYSLTKCRSYSQKLTGPLVDRFQMLNFSHQWKGERSVLCADLRSQLQELRERQDKTKTDGHGSSTTKMNPKTTLLSLVQDTEAVRPLDNAQRPEASFEVAQWPLLERKMMEQLQGSHRRYLSTLRVAQTLADLSGKKWPNAEDIEKAMKYTVTPFVELQRWD